MKHARLAAGVGVVVAATVVAVVIVVAVVADPSGAAQGSRATGVAGTVTLVNPGGPMIAPGQSPPPAPRLVVELLSPATKRPIARGETGPDGAFRIAAPPGTYLVLVAPATNATATSGGASTTEGPTASAGTPPALSRTVVVEPTGYAHLHVGPLHGL